MAGEYIYLALDEISGTALVDSSGNGRGGSYSGLTPAANSVGGLYSGTGTAINFNGPAQFTIQDVVEVFAGELTFMLAINPTSVDSVALLGKHLNDYFRITTATQVTFEADNVLTTFSHGHTFTTNETQHIALVREADGDLLVYRNGIPPTITANNTSPFDFRSLGSVNGGSFQFAGVMDEVRIFDRALSAAEVSSAYAALTQSNDSRRRSHQQLLVP